jgi:tetratricopeptide (TPR) repeat protein/serine/threonine protein kinase
MKCPDLAQLRLLLDGKLTPELFRPIEVHVEECPNCQATLHRLLSGAEVPPLPLGQGNRYRPVRFHARGGLGEVFVAEEPDLHREVALKRMQARYHDDPESCRRFLLEAEITGRLEHPGVVPVYGRGEDEGGQPCYAMRFIRGETKDDAIKRFHAADKPGRDPGERSLALRELLGRFVAVCNTVAYAHSRGILHRDLKPGNVMLDKYGQTLVVDWGLAKPIERDETARAGGEETLAPASATGGSGTQTGAAMGTPSYMSPEQASGQWARVGQASDIYSLGAILYTLLTGQTPFAGADAKEKLEKVKRGEFPRPRQVKKACPPALEAVCLKAMALRPEDRYATALALAADVEHWLGDEPVAAYGEPWPVRAARWARKHKPLVSGAAAALLVGLIGLSAGAIWYEQDQSRQAQEQLVRQNEADRQRLEAEQQRLLTEQRMDQALKQGSKVREKLQGELHKPGGVQSLLNQPARWAALLEAARSELRLARSLADRVGSALDTKWTKRMQQLEQELRRDEADYGLALRLEKIRLDKATWVEGKFDDAQAEREYPKAFHEAGLDMTPGRHNEIAALIKQSHIKEQLLVALDDWAWVAHCSKEPNLTGRLLEVARLTDPEPWRDKVRDLTLWKNSQAIVDLAEQAQADHKLMARLSPQVLVLVHLFLPQEKSEKWLRQAQALHSADFWINFLLAGVLRKKGEVLEAAGFYRVALALRPDTAAVYNNLGGCLCAQKDLPAAIAALKKAVDIEPNYAMAWSNLGLALADNKEVPVAIVAHKKALDIDPKLALAWSNLGVTLAQKDLPAAFDAFHKALDIDSEYAPAWNNLGVTLAEHKKDLPAAIVAFKKALDIAPNYADAWYNLANALNAQKKLPEAIDAYEKALAIAPKHAKAWHNLGATLAEHKDLPAAIVAFHKALDIEPKNAAKAWYNLGLALRAQKDLPAAIVAYHKALAIDPKQAETWNSLGNALRDQKGLPAAIDAYKKALVIEPKYAMAWSNLGTALHYQQEFPAAIDAFKKALDIEPKLAAAWNNLGLALAAQKQVPAAIEAFKNALAIEPNDAQAWNNLGIALYAQQKLPEAINAYKKALAIEPKNAVVWSNLGNALAAQNQPTEAIDAYTKALKIEAKFAEAWYNLGNALRAKQDLPRAIDAYKNALAIQPKHAQAWNNLGLALYVHKELPAAIDAFKKALKIDPNLAYAHAVLGLALRDQGDFADAVAAMQRALQLLPKGHAGRPLLEGQLKQCQQLLGQRLANALKGEKLSFSEYLALADLCQRYEKRYRDAVELYTKAFGAEPKLAEDRQKLVRYNAACAAALAAAGKGVGADNLPDKEKSRLRQQALDWLKADLAARGKLLEQNPFELQQDLQHWQKDADLASLRDAKELATLPAAEQDAWRQLWVQLETLRKEARCSYTETQYKSALNAKQREQTHPLQMSAGMTYVIDLESPQFDTYLRLEDSQGKVLAENDDISKDNLNSRILFTPKEDGTYRIIATSFQQRGSGAYTLTIRTFAVKNK